jgi:hypothetical protein
LGLLASVTSLFRDISFSDKFFIVLQNKDAGYVENQLQNIADAIDLLPRLATGIDVNLKFTRSASFIYLSAICHHQF